MQCTACTSQDRPQMQARELLCQAPSAGVLQTLMKSYCGCLIKMVAMMTEG